MIWLFAAVGLAAVVAIAFVSVGIAVGGMEAETAPAVYRYSDAVEFVADRLPDEVTARISHSDVGRVLRWHLDWFAEVGLATDHGAELGDPAVAVGEVAVVDTDAACDAVVARSLRESGPDPVDVVCILEAQLVYLSQIGALSAGAPPPDR
ncbi:MAG: hypothetical protein OXE79_00090 [Acidimicrobiaceae bacterium]|nr:hypothetical protein [Acidimicrobiaceae bacterium]MCY4175990.1 hypothetical protein [Acidimicrobiaceae bacterium]MCY4280444.1 hypothetical protein [Acidimicrobiaceae bacterium]MCY4295211.1 hypothetical protein [Acidimicrobiaceae bacterium]